MRTEIKIWDRVLALALAVMMVFATIPGGVFTVYAVETAELSSTLEETVKPNEWVEFTVTATANVDVGTTVNGTIEFTGLTPTSLEYSEDDGESWMTCDGSFGPSAGFELTEDAQQFLFRVMFGEEGTTELNAKLQSDDGINVTDVCTLSKEVTVEIEHAELSTTLADNIKPAEAVEFTVTATANDDVGTTVKGTIEFTGLTPASLEYSEDNATWVELDGTDFGSVDGFALTDEPQTFYFRVLFADEGTVTADVTLKSDTTDVCALSKEVTVEKNPATLTTTLGTSSFAIGEAKTFVVETAGNDDADTVVKGVITFDDDTAVDEIRYFESPESEGEVLTDHTFGPTEGFSLNADSTTHTLSVTFCNAGQYTATIQLVKADDDSEVCSAEVVVTVDKTTLTGITVNPTSNAYDGSDFDLVEVSGTEDGDTVTYSVNGGDFTSTLPQDSAVDNYEVTVKVERNANYTIFEQTVISEITLGNIDLGGLSVVGLKGTYNGEAQDAVIVKGKSDSYLLEYRLDGGDWQTEIPKVTDAGTYQVYVRAFATNYNDKDVPGVPFNVKVGKADQSDFAFEESEVQKTWSAENSFLNAASGGQTGGNITYSVDGEMPKTASGADCITLQEDGTVTVNGSDATPCVVTIKAVLEGNDNYNSAEATYTLTVSRADQSGFAFAELPETVTYNDLLNNQFVLAVVGGNGSGEVTYAITSGDGVSLSGNVVTVLRADTVTIQAQKAADDHYNAATAVHTLVVQKANQSIVFNDTDTSSIVYGNGFANSASEIEDTETPDGKGYAAGTTITYDIIEGAEIASVDANGVLHFASSKTGTITVRANKPGDDCYNDTFATYTIEVVYANVPTKSYTLSGDKKNDSGWYTGDVTITPADGYKISVSNSLELSEEDWKNEISVSDEGYNGKTVYLKGEDGISGAIVIPEDSIRIDKSAPRALNITPSTPSVLDTVLGTLSLGYYNTATTITLTATDDVSHIASFAYTYGENNGIIEAADMTFSADGKEATATFSIDPQFRGKISFRATDVAGNYAEESDDHEIVVDTVAPVVEIEFDNTSALNGTYYKDDRTATIRITEANFDNALYDEGNLTVTVTANGGTPKVYDADSLAFTMMSEGVWEATVLFDTDADYTLSVDCTDFSGNYDALTSHAETSFTLDKTAPQLSIDYTTTETPLNEDHFAANRTALITLVEHNFVADEASVNAAITLTAKNIMGEAMTLQHDYAALLSDPTKWTSNGDTHTIALSFEDNARYQFEITYTDLAGNEQTASITDEFCIDKEAPKTDDFKISYSTSLLNTILQNITLGFYDAPVTVTIEAVDKISGIDFFTYACGEVVGTSPEMDTVISTGISYSETHEHASAQFVIQPEFRGSVSFMATDRAGNESEPFTDEKVIIVDTIAPGVTVVYDNDNVSNGKYYDAPREATITINEANFFADAYGKVVVKDSNPEEKIAEHLVITVSKNGGAPNTVKPTFAKKAGTDDEWTTKYKFEDDADYTWTIEYTDFSNHAANKYEKSFVIDKTAPQVSMEYTTTETPINEDHFAANRTALLTVVEHNFDSVNAAITLTAKDITGEAVTLNYDYAALLQNPEKWDTDGDTHTIALSFENDARYQFEITYTDLAGNEQAASITDEFCIDKEAPNTDDFKISYSTSLLNTILQGLSFGFYQTSVTVTIEAIDDVSGISSFAYSYSVQEGASSVNAGKGATNIPTTDIDYSIEEKGERAVAEFEIPAQFRGLVSFTATDRSGNTSAVFTDTMVVVVDAKVPGLSVLYQAYNDDKVPVDDTASHENYYKANRTATITIDEANFFAEAYGKNADPTSQIGEYLVITVSETDNDGNTETNVITPEFTNTTGDIWTTTVDFNKDADYTWSIAYKDFSNNTADAFEDTFTIDKIAPVLSIAYQSYNKDDEIVEDTAVNEIYYHNNRKATVTIVEHNFKPDEIVASFSANDMYGTVDPQHDYVAMLKDAANWTSDGNTHTITLPFDVDAMYAFDIAYTDMANNEQEKKIEQKFCVDKVVPDIDILANSLSVLQDQTFTFDRFYASDVQIDRTANDAVGGLKKVEYQRVSKRDLLKDDGWTVLWESDPEAEIPEDQGPRAAFGDHFEVSPNEKLVVYLRATDYAGNVKMLNTRGLVVDNEEPQGEWNAPMIDIIPDEPNANGLYNKDVTVNLKVVDPIIASSGDNSESCSGLREISYQVYAKDIDRSVDDILFDYEGSFDVGDASINTDDLVSEWTGSFTIPAETFNSNNVVVEVTAYDNAGNERVTTTEELDIPIRIDITNPTIAVTYDNNEGDTAFANEETEAFFNQQRTATVVITERNFDPANVKAMITNTDGDTPAFSEWTMVQGTGNGDNTTHTATLTYAADGDYTFDISYTDQANNENTPVEYNGLAPQKFTVDRTLPVFTVTYDNNDVSNGNYFRAGRTATLTIVEHNFEPTRAKVTLTATDGGTAVTLPAMSEWTADGDTHRATIRYTDDALYTFDIEYTDKAGNAMADFEEESFSIDQTSPVVAITPIVDQSANNNEGDIGFAIRVTDSNFDTFTPVITVVTKEGDEFVTKRIEAGAFGAIENGQIYTVGNLPEDGIYRVSLTVVDKAGNAYTSVMLSREDGSMYTENRAGNDTLLTFSVNRNGSTFELGEQTQNLLGHYYLQSVDEDIVIVEINTDEIVERTVMLNGKPLNESQVRIEQTGGVGDWKRYTYTIDKALFEDEGEYNVVIFSTDRATNDAFSDMKDASVKFVVDRTAPVVTVSGLETDGRYQTEKQLVTIVPTDDGGALYSVVVMLVDRQGNTIKELIRLSGEDLAKRLEEEQGQLSFEVDEGLYQNVRIICDDEAYYGDGENVLYDETITNVSIASSTIAILWANAAIRWSVIGGSAALVGSIGLLAFLKKRRVLVTK